MTMGLQQGSGSGSGGSGVRAPRTRAELDGLVARRGELQGQLRNSEERRFMLSQQAQHTPADGRAALNERLATLDTRIASMERQIQQLDDAIATGLANPELHGGADVATGLLVSPPAPPPTPEPVIMLPPPDQSFPVNARNVVLGGLVSLSLLALIVWLAVRSALRRSHRGGAAGAVDQSQISQLQQSVDAIAVEVERISENQRYVTRLLNEQPPGIGISAGDRPDVQRVPAQQSGAREK